MSDLILVGCGKTKERYALVASDLYTGPLFVTARDVQRTSNASRR